MQPARLGQRPTLVNTEQPIRLCYVTVAAQRAAEASHPTSWYRPTAYGRTDRRQNKQTLKYLVDTCREHSPLPPFGYAPAIVIVYIRS